MRSPRHARRLPVLRRPLLGLLAALAAVAVLSGFTATAAPRPAPEPDPVPSWHEETAPVSFAGVASWYGEWFRGKPVACGGEPYDPDALTAAHRWLPCGTKLRLSHASREVVVTITDRGPFVEGRVLDLTPAAFAALADPDRGLIGVRATLVSP